MSLTGFTMDGSENSIAALKNFQPPAMDLAKNSIVFGYIQKFKNPSACNRWRFSIFKHFARNVKRFK
jgi:hypothetical protein